MFTSCSENVHRMFGICLYNVQNHLRNFSQMLKKCSENVHGVLKECAKMFKNYLGNVQNAYRIFRKFSLTLHWSKFFEKIFTEYSKNFDGYPENSKNCSHCSRILRKCIKIFIEWQKIDTSQFLEYWS